MVELKKFSALDIPYKVKWINDPINNKFLHYDLPLEEEKTLHWFNTKDNTKRLDLTIFYNNTPVGLIGLLNIDKEKKDAELYILLGEHKFKNKGIAKKAIKNLIAIAEEIGLSNIYLYTEVDNFPAQNLFDSMGFIKEQKLENHLYYNERYISRFMYKYYIFEKQLPPIYIQKVVDENNNLYILRDDLLDFSFGGNKYRKAILSFQTIINDNYNAIVTYGSSSSNHCRIISNLSFKYDKECYIITPNNDVTLNTKLNDITKSKYIYSDLDKIGETIDKTIFRLREKGKKVYFIPGGGHDTNGTKAFVDVFNKIHKYENDNNLNFDYIFFASGTGTTQAGLIIGKKINDSNIKVIGISVARQKDYGTEKILEAINEYSKINIKKDEIFLIDDYISNGYGKYNENIINTIIEQYQKNGLSLDPTYTGKAFWGMQEFLKEKKIKNKNIMFIHTGGTPLFFDYINKMR